MKKLTFKYLLEFVVIVLGISVSFWFDKYQNRIEDAKKERVVFSDLNTELRIISSMIENRRAAFLFDIQIINSLLQNSAKDSIQYNYDDLLTAVTDWRGFTPSEEIYTSLKYDGGLKFITSIEIKAAIEAFYHGTKAGILANMEDEVMVQREILKYLQYNHPQMLLMENDIIKSEAEKIALFKSVLNNDPTLQFLLISKLRFMGNKNKGMQNYKRSHENLVRLLN
jgi:hypothetical protein